MVLAAHLLPHLPGALDHCEGDGPPGVLMNPDEAEDLQRRYHRQRVRWMRSIGIPVSAEWDDPDPGELDAEDPELG